MLPTRTSTAKRDRTGELLLTTFCQVFTCRSSIKARSSSLRTEGIPIHALACPNTSGFIQSMQTPFPYSISLEFVTHRSTVTKHRVAVALSEVLCAAKNSCYLQLPYKEPTRSALFAQDI